jgi:alpha-tubulin suppressor-like RCC1 family protein
VTVQRGFNLHGHTFRSLVAMSLAAGLLAAGAAGAAAAAPAAKTKVSAHATPSTAHIGSVLVVSGVVSPRGAGAASVQRLVGHSWRTIGHAKVSAKGAYTLSLRAPKTAASWTLRVVRPASKAISAGASAALHVRIVKAIYAVTATTAASVSAGQPIVVTGKVSPKATGTLWLQRLQGRTWLNFASTKLTNSSSYAIRTTRPAGSYRLRVVKAFSAKVAGGISRAATVTVTAVAAPVGPSVTTTSLPAASVNVAYTATLTASGGSAPYAWVVLSGSLPLGLTLSTAGVVSGKPTASATSRFTVAALDSAAKVATAALSLVVGPSPFLSHTVRGWGLNDLGQLGNGTTTPTPVNISVGVLGLTGVVSTAGGYKSGYAMRDDGTVWAWGSNGQGELGNGSLSDSDVPVQVAGLTDVTAIAVVYVTVLALKADGTVWAWGDGSHGALGSATITQSRVPVQVSGVTGVTAIAMAGATGYALKADGTLWAWGDNQYGELGDGSALPAADRATPGRVGSLAGVKAIAVGTRTAFALMSGGTVQAWGLGTEGELGNGGSLSSSTPVAVNTITGVTAIGAGENNGYAISGGNVWAWGANLSGQLGDGTVNPRNSPQPVPGQTGMSAVASDQATVYTLKSDGTVYACGAGANGQLGNGTSALSKTPVQVLGVTHAVGISAGYYQAYAVTTG